MAVYVTKYSFIDILGQSALPFAMFMANGTQAGLAVQILFNNADKINLESDFIINHLIPFLLYEGAITQSAVDAVNAYIASINGV